MLADARPPALLASEPLAQVRADTWQCLVLCRLLLYFLSVAIFFWQSGICVGQMPHGALALAGEGASPCAGPFSDARPSTPLTAAQNRHIVQLETLLAKERSEHAVLKHRHAACEHELSDLRMSLYGRRESDETLESLQSHIKELQIMIWQVRRAPDYLTTDWCMLMNIAEMDAYV